MDADCIEVLDFSDPAHLLISTKDRYRTIIHKEDGEEIHGELLTFEEAHAFCQTFNSLRWRRENAWAEFIDYKEAHHRQERDQYWEDVEEHAERLLKRREKKSKRRHAVKMAS
jgi:hypothetical protein